MSPLQTLSLSGRKQNLRDVTTIDNWVPASEDLKWSAPVPAYLEEYSANMTAALAPLMPPVLQEWTV